MQPSEEIKQKLDIVDVIKEYIRLTPAGTNFRALCPFHNEKSPSFMVSPDKQIWHCFGCSRGGDVFAFVMEMEGYDFREALRALAPKAGVVLRSADPRQQSRRNRIMDILDWSRRYYREALSVSPAAAAARGYLAKRGLDGAAIEEWQIGYSPDTWNSVLKFLKAKGYREAEIAAAGMIVKTANGQNYYDRFRGRIMFPINDINGNTIAFSARVSPEKEAEEKMGKYINSPQTEVYDKSRVLFGLDKAKIEIKKRGQAVIVEGQMDAISAQVGGWKNTVASSGTALSADQIQLIKRYSENIILAFDPDSAGAMAADRGVQTALGLEMSIRVAVLPPGMDPDNCIRRNKPAWEAAVAGAEPMMQYVFNRVFSRLDPAKPEDKRRAAAELIPTIVRLGSRIEQDHWLRQLAEKLDVEEALLREAISRRKSQDPAASPPEAAGRPAPSPKSKEAVMGEHLLALAIKFPQFIGQIIDKLPADQLRGEALRNLYKEMVIYYNIISSSKAGEPSDPAGFDYKNFKQYLEKDCQAGTETIAGSPGDLLNRLVFLGDEIYAELESERVSAEIGRLIAFLKRSALKQRMRAVQKSIAASEKAGDQAEAEKLMEELKALADDYQELG